MSSYRNNQQFERTPSRNRSGDYGSHHPDSERLSQRGGTFNGPEDEEHFHSERHQSFGGRPLSRGHQESSGQFQASPSSFYGEGGNNADWASNWDGESSRHSSTRGRNFSGQQNFRREASRHPEDQHFFGEEGSDSRHPYNQPRSQSYESHPESFQSRGDVWSDRGLRQSYGGQGRHFGRGPQGYQRSDERIKEEICDTLMRDSEIDVENVTIEVSECVVTLKGQVDSKHCKRMVEDLCEEVLGVKEVENQLKCSQRHSQGQQFGTQQNESSSEGARLNSGNEINSGTQRDQTSKHSKQARH